MFCPLGELVSQVSAVDSDSGSLGTIQYEISPDTDPVTRYGNALLGMNPIIGQNYIKKTQNYISVTGSNPNILCCMYCTENYTIKSSRTKSQSS